jgi:flagellar basal body P-ring formation protein FlgA
MKIVLTAVSLVLFVLWAGASFGQQAATQATTQAVIIEKKLTDTLKEAYATEGMQVKLEGVPGHLKQHVRIKSVNVHKMPEVDGKGLAFVEFEGEDGKVRNSYIPFRVYEKKKLFYAKRALPKGTAVSVDDLGTKETYISENDLIYPKDPQDVAGKVLKRDVGPGMVLTMLILDNPQVVHRGETVTVVVENTQLLVRIKGKAQEPGRVGEKIRVKNLATDRELVGKVTDNGTVIVEF